MAYEQEEIWAELKRLHARVVRLETERDARRAIPELQKSTGDGDIRRDLEDATARLNDARDRFLAGTACTCRMQELKLYDHAAGCAKREFE